MKHIIDEFGQKMDALITRVDMGIARWKLNNRLIAHHNAAADSKHLLNPPKYFAGVLIEDLLSGKADWPDNYGATFDA